MGPIIGDVEDSLKNVYLLATEESERALSRLDRDLEGRVAAAQAAEQAEQADLIMDTKSFYQDEVKRLLETRNSLDHAT